MSDFFSSSEARELCERILAETSADAAEVKLNSGLNGYTRFVQNQIVVSSDVVNAEATVFVTFGTRSGSVTLNDLSGASISRAVAKAHDLVRSVRADSEYVPLLGPQRYSETDAYFERTHGLSFENRADAVASVIERVEPTSLTADGMIQRSAGSFAVANTAGLFGYHQATLGSFTTTVHNADGVSSGWAGTTHNDWERTVPVLELAERAVAKARLNGASQAIDPGPYTVVLEPTAVGHLVGFLFPSLDARFVHDGRSLFANEVGGDPVGERVVDERLTLLSDPNDPDIFARPFTDDGLPVGRTTWISNGMLENLAADRLWAAQHERDALPLAGGIKMTGGECTAEDLVAVIDRGILVTRLMYEWQLDGSTETPTGQTLGGAFLIENGSVTRAVGDLRFEASPISILNNIATIGSAVRVVAGEFGLHELPVVVPPLVVRDFHLTPVPSAN